MELWARNCPVILPKFPIPHKFRDLLHAANLRHGTDGFTSPPKEGVLRIFFRRIMSMKNSVDTFWNRTSDLPICSTAPLTTVLLRSPFFKRYCFQFRERPHKQTVVTGANVLPRRFYTTQSGCHEVKRLWRRWAMRTVGQAVTTTGIVVEADIRFQKEENIREYNKYLQTCIAAVHGNAYSDLASSNPYNAALLQP